LHRAVDNLLPTSLEAAVAKAMPKTKPRAGAMPAPLEGHSAVMAALGAAAGRPCFAELCWETAAAVESKLLNGYFGSTVAAPVALGSTGAWLEQMYWEVKY
jgi:hypothetical protein